MQQDKFPMRNTSSYMPSIYLYFIMFVDNRDNSVLSSHADTVFFFIQNNIIMYIKYTVIL